MKPRLLVVWVLAGISSVAIAAEPTTQPVVPVDQIPVPAARESAPAAVVSPGDKIVILPFEVMGDAQRRDWVSRAVQENLSTEAARSGGVVPISAPAPSDQIDTAAALDAAKALDGNLVVFGACEFDGPDVRITGQIVNVKTGSAIAGLKASGDFRDLFALEDVLTGQLARALHPPIVVTAGTPRAGGDPMIFNQTAPPLTAADLFPPPTDATRFADQYNQYYYDQGWDDYGGYLGYGGFGYGGFGYYRRNIGSYWPVHSYYGPSHISYPHPTESFPGRSTLIMASPSSGPGPMYASYGGGGFRH
jgi:TolB-like protein